MKITRSYSRKLNHGTYGGVQFETTDHSASIETDVEDTEDEIVRIAKNLEITVVEIVNHSVELQIKRLQKSGRSTEEREQTNGQILESVRKEANLILNVSSYKKLIKLWKEIKNGDYKPNELKYLRKLKDKRKEKLEP